MRDAVCTFRKAHESLEAFGEILEKALKMGQISASGGFQLLIGVVTSNVIMAVGTIILARLLLPAEYGLYTIALIPSTIVNLFRDWGVTSAITKYVAQFKAAEKEENIRDTIAAGLVFEVSAGLVLCVLSIFLSGFIASTVLRRPEAAPYISIVSITIFSGSLLTATQNSFVGFERMELNSLTLIIQAIVKAVMSPLLVILGYGVLGPVLGYTLSFLVTGLLGLAILYFLLYRNLKGIKTNRIGIPKTLRIMLRYGVPLSISTLLTGFLAQFYSLMMAIYISDNVLIGNLHIAINFAVLLTFFTVPISTVLFPAFAKLSSQNEQRLLKMVFTSSVRYTAMLLVPATAAVMVLSKPMIYTLFGAQWSYAPSFLTLYVISNIFSGIGNLSLVGLLSGLGETRVLMKLTILTQIFGIPLGFLLIPNLGMIGVIIGPIIAGVPTMLVGLHWIWKRYRVSVDWGSTVRIITASAIAGGATYLSLDFLDTVEPLRLVGGGTVFLLVYIVCASIIGAINQSDISNLKAIFSGLGFVTEIIDPLLKALEKILGKIRPLRQGDGY